jgi:hypothetical protein
MRHGAHDEAREAMGEQEADDSAAEGREGVARVGGEEEECKKVG